MDTASFPSFSSISPRELAALLDGPRAPLLLDVRRQPAFDGSDCMLAGARRCDDAALAALAAAQPGGDVVVYCVHGHQVSQQAAQRLRDAGWNARFLAGGLEGCRSGTDALPTVRKQPGPSEGWLR